MKLELNITATGAQISRSASQIPPLGMIFPSQQDSIANVASSLANLASSTDSALPAGFQVFSGADIYGWTGSGWEDGNTGNPVTDAALPAGFTVNNPESYDIGVTW